MKKYIGLFLALVSLVFVVFACDMNYTPAPSQKVETDIFQHQTEQNEESVRNIIENNELPKLNFSADFDNVKKRLEYLNTNNNVGYLYIFQNGVLIREVQVLNKTTSLNTFITPMEEIRMVEKGHSSYQTGCYPGTYVVVEAPDQDGTYGTNANGVFWFTPDGVYQEMTGEGFLAYFSAERLSISTQPIIVNFE